MLSKTVFWILVGVGMGLMLSWLEFKMQSKSVIHTAELMIRDDIS